MMVRGRTGGRDGVIVHNALWLRVGPIKESYCLPLESESSLDPDPITMFFMAEAASDIMVMA